MNLAKILFSALLVILMAMHSASAAEPAPSSHQPAAAGGFFADMDGAIRQFATKADETLAKSMTDSALELAKKASSSALVIGGGLVLIYLMYEIMQFLSGKTRSMLVVLFDIGIPCIFAALLIKEYATILPKFETVLDVIRTLGGANPIGAIMDMYGAVLTNVTSAIKHAFEEVTAGGKFALITNPGAQMLKLADLFLTCLFVLGILALLLMGVSELLGLLLMGPFLYAVGVAFGPIMIAGIVTPWTRDYFTKWLQFLVISAGLTGVINVIFTLAAAIMKKMGVMGYTEGEPTAVSLLILAVLLMTINSMISQAPSIASALFPGHVGVAKSTGQQAKDAVKNAKDLGSKATMGTLNTAMKTKQMTAGAIAKLGQMRAKTKQP